MTALQEVAPRYVIARAALAEGSSHSVAGGNGVANVVPAP